MIFNEIMFMNDSKDKEESDLVDVEINEFVSEIYANKMPPFSPEDTYLTLKEVALMLRVSRSTIISWLKSGDFIRPIVLGPYKEGNSKAAGNKVQLWRLSSLREFINERDQNYHGE